MPYLLPPHDNGQVHVLHHLHTEETAGEPLEISARHPTDVCSTVGHAKGIGMGVMLARLIAVITAALPIIESHYVHNGW